MSDKRINQFNSGSITDDSLIIIGDPNNGNLYKTGYKSVKDYIYNDITGSNIDTGSLLLTASFNAFTQSYYDDSASFDNRITNISSSLLTGSYVDSASFGTYSSSVNIIINNVYASESNYLITTSFNTYTSSVNTQILNVYASESRYLPTSSYLTDSASFNNRINNITGSGGSNSGSFIQYMWVVGGANNFTSLSGSPIPPGSGSSTLTDGGLIGCNVRVSRNGLMQIGFNPGDGDTFYTKIKSSNTVNFSSSLSSGEKIIVETI